ncbi:2-hydroxychromene-2-carboxylate isomerase [Noviherbaspirillum saxi]|uniref:2-hydroxychromene-2-carboxylate isomerase n=1 Tax=Noviherbaspirillum saxi TaxID=2320863 RepID=UPI001F389E79|nr:2-hydroxychromene-2-carboxylate isomerase [Noviherbaspirillum saxi]
MNTAHTLASPPRLEFWFEFGSNYSYLATMRIEELARRAGVALEWKPFLLGPIFRELGWSSSPFVLQAEKGNYVWRDMERQARKYGLPFNKPSAFPRAAVLPMRVAACSAGEPWIAEFCKNVMVQNWVNDLDINEVLNVRHALEALVPEPDIVIRQATSEENKARLRRNTEIARARGIFGAPTFLVGDEMFWGNDRLEEAIAMAASAQGNFLEVRTMLLSQVGQ